MPSLPYSSIYRSGRHTLFQQQGWIPLLASPAMLLLHEWGGFLPGILCSR